MSACDDTFCAPDTILFRFGLDNDDALEIPAHNCVRAAVWIELPLW
jgi:hypothetical protein